MANREELALQNNASNLRLCAFALTDCIVHIESQSAKIPAGGSPNSSGAGNSESLWFGDRRLLAKAGSDRSVATTAGLLSGE
jgi:hypothetical protein